MSDDETSKREKFAREFRDKIRAIKEARANGESGPVRQPSAFILKIRAQKEARQERLRNGLTLEALRATEDQELGQLVMDYLSEKRKQAGVRGEAFVEWVGKLPVEFRAVYVSTCLDGEVGNGGFAAVYYNSTKALEAYFLEAFELMRATGHAGIVRRAMEFQRRGETEAMGALDKEFYALDRTEKLKVVQGRFIRGREERFAVD